MSLSSQVQSSNSFHLLYLNLPLASHQISSGINPQEDEEQDGETPKRTTSITEERQRNTDNRCQAEHHAHIDKQVEEEHTQHAISIHSPKLEGLPLRQMYQPQYQRQEEQQDSCRAEETFLLAHRTEDEVGILLWHKLQLRLRSIQEAFALQATRADGYLTLMHIISSTSQVFIQAQEHIDTHSLVRLHHIVEHIVG